MFTGAASETVRPDRLRDVCRVDEVARGIFDPRDDLQVVGGRELDVDDMTSLKAQMAAMQK